MKTAPAYPSEAAMCAHFMDYARAVGWTPYPETQGWDILLAHANGYQIGIQAKLALNVDVLNQTLESRWDMMDGRAGVDYRAILVPRDKTGKLTLACAHLGLTVITGRAGTPHPKRANWVRVPYPKSSGSYETIAFEPSLPFTTDWHEDEDRHWFDRCPVERMVLPEYVPDVSAGVSGPRQLSFWKIKAIKIAVLLETRGFVTKADFTHLKISPATWLTSAWLAYHPDPEMRGAFVAHRLPDFKAQHPRNYGEIAADIDKWKPPAPGLLAVQEERASRKVEA